MTSGMDYVGLTSRFTSGWPWPDDSWGLDPMYGTDGWCHACGVPNRDQVGSLVLRAGKLPKGSFWMPNWRFNALCLRLPDAAEIIDRFTLRTLYVRTPRSLATGICQLLPAPAAHPWYDSALLTERAKARHGQPGEQCATCRTWRWYPLPLRELPAPAVGAEVPFLASQEWFGSGCKAFRQLLFRRDLAVALVALGPRIWSIEELPPGE